MPNTSARPFKLDAGAPIQQVVKRPSAQETKKLSVFGMKALWLVPLLAEVTLLLGAAWLSIFLKQIVFNGARDFPAAPIAAIVVVYMALMIYCRMQELFLPRAVAVVGVGALLLTAAGFSLVLLVDAYLLGGRARLYKALLVVTPLNLFIFRCFLLFREARFAPTIASLEWRLKANPHILANLKDKLRFWLS